MICQISNNLFASFNDVIILYIDSLIIFISYGKANSSRIHIYNNVIFYTNHSYSLILERNNYDMPFGFLILKQ